MSFRREAHVPKGGPDGGDGGGGGDVVLFCDDSLRDLRSLARRVHYEAACGRHGEGSQRHGADGDALMIAVPPGTHVAVDNEHAREYDLLAPGQRAVVARGGSGGRGNRRFAGSRHQAPRFAERGLPGEEAWVELKLKLLADVGLVGLPNAGKSSLLARMTRARPKVANYPFTTLAPVLGTIEGEHRQLVIADIPGLIEGAADGHGLGHDFLAHIERTRLLVHVVDIAPADGSDPVASYRAIERELQSYDPGLALLPRVLVLSKADLIAPDLAAREAAAWRERLTADDRDLPEWERPTVPQQPVILTSAATGAGIDRLRAELLRRVTPLEIAAASADDLDALPEHRVFRPTASGGRQAARVSVIRDDDDVWVVTGSAVDMLIARHDLDNADALDYVEHRLRRLGVIAALEAAGFKSGDDVEIGGILFDLDPS